MKSKMILNRFRQIFSTIRIKSEDTPNNLKEPFPEVPDGYFTLTQVAKIVDACMITIVRNKELLPPDTCVKQQRCGMPGFRWLINQAGVDILKSINQIPEGYISVSELCAMLDVSSPTLYAFLHKNGYYERALKLGNKRRRYYKILFDPDMAKEILKKYSEMLDKKASSRTCSQFQPISDFMDTQFITPELIQFMGTRTEVLYIDGAPCVSKHISHRSILNDYMLSLGFIPVPDATDRLGVSRQRMHQIISAPTVRDDESIVVRLSGNRKTIYVSENFIDTFVESKHVGPPEGYLSVAAIASLTRIKTKILRVLIANTPQIPYYQIGVNKFYDKNSVLELAEKYRTQLLYKAEIESKKEAEAGIIPWSIVSDTVNIQLDFETLPMMPMLADSSDWLTLTSVAGRYSLKTYEIMEALQQLGLNNLEYIRPRNGLSSGKHKLINPSVVKILDDCGYGLRKKRPQP